MRWEKCRCFIGMERLGNVMDTSILAGIVFGIIASSTLNLGKAMQKQGIEMFDRSKPGRAKKSSIWVAGATLSFIQPVFQITSQTVLGASATVFTAMMGTGILVLLAYSWKVIGEPANRFEIVGSLLIIAGTLVFGVTSLFLPANERPAPDIGTLAIVLAITGILFGTLLSVTIKTKRSWGLSWGLVGGSMLGIDIIFKSLASETGGIDLGMASGFTSPFFYLSIPFGFCAFAFTQIGYTRAKAITVVPTFTAFYMLLPLVVESLVYVTWPAAGQVVGVSTCIAGVVLSTRFKTGMIPVTPVVPGLGGSDG